MNSREDVINNLLKLDQDLDLVFKNAEKLKLLVIGGAAMLLHEIKHEYTEDIDVYSIEKDSFIGLKKPIKEIAMLYEINSQLYNDIKEISEILSIKCEYELDKDNNRFKNMEIYILTKESLASMKLLSVSLSNRHKDILDINILKQENINLKKVKQTILAWEEANNIYLNKRLKIEDVFNKYFK